MRTVIEIALLVTYVLMSVLILLSLRRVERTCSETWEIPPGPPMIEVPVDPEDPVHMEPERPPITASSSDLEATPSTTTGVGHYAIQALEGAVALEFGGEFRVMLAPDDVRVLSRHLYFMAAVAERPVVRS